MSFSWIIQGRNEITEKSDNSDSNIVYLNNAGQARISAEVKAAGLAAIERPPWESDCSNDQQRCRELFASLIEADPKDIAINPSTAFAITMAARNLQQTISNHGKTGKILLLQDQYDSAVYPWQTLCNESNGKVSLEIISHPDPEETDGWTKAILRKIEQGDILAACLPPLHWSNGALIDLETIGVACRKHSIALVVDATQVIGIMPLSIQKIKPVFLACTVHKWLRSPPGASLVYIDRDVQQSWQPLDFHGRSRKFPEGTTPSAEKNEIGPNGYPDAFVDDARKFDCGGRANPLLIPMIRTALESIVHLDLIKIQQDLEVLMTPLIEWALAHGYKTSSKPRGYHLVGIEPPNCSVEKLLEMTKELKNKGIIVATRCGGLRISPYVDTTPAEVTRIIQVLNDLKI